MDQIKSIEKQKKSLLEKIAAKLTQNKNTICAVRHAAHMSAHASHGNRYH